MKSACLEVKCLQRCVVQVGEGIVLVQFLYWPSIVHVSTFVRNVTLEIYAARVGGIFSLLGEEADVTQMVTREDYDSQFSQ